MLSILICVSDPFLRFLIFWDLKDIAKKKFNKNKIRSSQKITAYTVLPPLHSKLVI